MVLRGIVRSLPGFVIGAGDLVFQTWPDSSGHPQPLSHSALNYGIQRLWADAVLKSSLTATRIRKAVVTHVRGAVPGAKEYLASHMSHSLDTQECYYKGHS